MKAPSHRIRIPVLLSAGLLLSLKPLFAGPVVWDNSDLTGLWSTANNWDTNVEPTSADDVTFPVALGGTITLNSGEQALSVIFSDDYTLTGGNLNLAAGNSIEVGTGVTAIINSALLPTGGVSKEGDGILVLGGSNSGNGTGNDIMAGTLRIANNNALGGSSSVTTVNNGTTLEFATGLSQSRKITFMQGGTIKGNGTTTNNGTITVDAAATSVTLTTGAASDLFTLTTGTNDLTGGTAAATVIDLSGAGTVRLNTNSDYAGSWELSSGVLAAGTATALGNQNTESITLSGGTLSVRRNSATNFATGSPANNLTVTASSGLRSDRLSNGAGATHTLGTLSMGSLTLTVDPGAMVISGTAGITVGDVNLSGDPVFAVNDNAGGNGKFTAGALLGGGVARTITKTGAGDLAANGGATDLLSGSSLTATGGGTIEMLFPNLGASATVNITAAQNPFGESTISITGGGLTLHANGSGNGTAQTYVLSSDISLGGTLTLDADRQSGSNSNKTFELPGLSLAAGTDLAMAGDHTHGVLVSGAVMLAGNATLRGVNITNQDGQLTFDSGITGSGSDALTIEGGTSPLNLTMNAASTYGGGTVMNGSNVTLNTVDGFGTGTTTMNGGNLTVNAMGALNGTINANGGTIRVNGVDFLSANPVVINGGDVDFRDNASGTITTGGLTVSGTSTIGVGRNTSGFNQVFDFPALAVSGDTNLTVTQANNFQPNFQSIDLNGNLTLFNGLSTTRIQAITETGGARALIKDGNGTLELEGANAHTGGTEVIDGTLVIEDAAALGTGTLTIGDSSGIETAIARFNPGLTIANDIVARAGGTGNLTLDASTGNVNWDGDVDLQRTLRIDNGSSTQDAFLNGQITGAGGLTKISAGEIILSDATNSFGSGAADSITISDGFLTVASDSALGNASNGITLAGTDGVLKIDGTFASSRSLTFNGTATGVAVTAGNSFTMNSSLLGTGTFTKSDAGTFILPAGTDNTARGSATTSITGGTLRVQDEKGLSDAGPITMNSNSTPFGVLELLRDPDTNFGHAFTANGTNTIHVDRAAGGSGTNGRHTVGAVTTTSGKLTVTGDNGYGLTLGDYVASANPTLTNDAPGTLIVTSLTGNPGTSTRTLTVAGSGVTEISGAMTQGAGTGSYRLAKNDAGTFRLGASITGFSNRTTVRDGTLDLNGLIYLSEDLDLGGAASVGGAQIVAGAGSLQLTTGLAFFSNGSPAGAVITGTVDLGNAASPFSIANSGGAAVDTTIDGPITGIAGSSITKSGSGTLRFTGAGNTYPGLTTVTAGDLELGKSAGDGIGTGGLSVSNADVILLASNQINDTGSVLLSGTNSDTRLELSDFTETVGPLTIEQTDAFDYAGVRTGATGTLVLGGDLTLSNNSDSSGTDDRNILITGTGSDSIPATDGILDLGGVNRTINVTTTTVGANQPDANATIETQIINGGIVKTGPQCLFLGHPNNTFAGGIQIDEGTITPASAGSLGTGGFSFANTGAANAGIDLGGLTGTFSDPINITGSGSGTSTIIYSAPKPNSLILSGGINLDRDLVIDVVNGSVNDGDTATLDVSGPVDDGGDTANLTKTGMGTLKLAAANTYSGSTTIEGGLLSIPADNALGDGTNALTIDGGALDATAAFALARDVTFGANGGSIRVDSPNTLTIPGTVTWGSGESAFFGSGTTILSGATSGSGGDLAIGFPTDFADNFVDPNVGLGHVLAFRGSAALPTGNLRIVKNAVLELGTGDFTRSLGTGAGEFQMDTNKGGGWAAHGADRIVNVGGGGATVTWGQQSPAFLYAPLSGSDYGDLILGSATATHTVDFQNPVELDAGASGSVARTIVVNDGSASLDGRISGAITQSAFPLPFSTRINVEGAGQLEISGAIGSDIEFRMDGTGTVTLSGSNSLSEDLDVTAGTLVFANDGAFGAPKNIDVDAGATLDASAMTVPLDVPQFIAVDGTIDGDVDSTISVFGNGGITGDLHLMIGGSLGPGFGSQFQVGGDFTVDTSAAVFFSVDGLVPDVDFTRMNVTGAVNLAGNLEIGSTDLTVGDSVILITNDGTDAITGMFAGLPEGGAVPVGNGIALMATYLANGDGGSIGNDFGVTAIVDTISTDLVLNVSAPLVYDFGDTISLVYTITSSGPADVTDGVLTVTIPGNATFVSSTPSGTLNVDELTVPLPPLIGADSTTVTVVLTAPGSEDSVFVAATVSSSTPEVDTDNNDAGFISAVVEGGTLSLNKIEVDLVAGTVHIEADTIDGIDYVIQSATYLKDWQDIYYFTGDGTPYEYWESLNLPIDHYRFGIRGFDNSGGGGGEE